MATKSGNRILRRSVAGMEGMWAKMWDPPRDSPQTPELIDITGPGPFPPGVRPNPVPAFMQSLGLGIQTTPNTVQRTLLNGLVVSTWDNAKQLEFMTFNDPDFAPGAAWPGPTIRVPRGVIFHCDTSGKGPPPHTIHWHGQEPTPMNDGVGHCSMEIGQYTYQLQPNFIGTYFYHCHRNTVQHFEFGLYGMLLIEPPDAFDEGNPNRGGYPRRTAANLDDFPQFADVYTPGDPTWGVAPSDQGDPTDPHAYTVQYDQEALWVFDDRDSVWSDLAGNAKTFYPGGANTGAGPHGIPDPNPANAGENLPTQRPGWDDDFANGFFHDYNADYWFVTGQPVPAAKFGTAEIGSGLVIPRNMNSGVQGMRVDIDANRGETILVRCLNAAYNTIEVSFPFDVTIIAFDGRALGVPPFARYNHAFTLPANTPYRLTTARRFDALIRLPTTAPQFDGFATAKFFDTRGIKVRQQAPLMTAQVPIKIN